MLRSPPVSTFAPSCLADVDIGEDLLQLLVRGLRADHRRRIERIALLDRLDALQRPFHEPVVDRFLDQRAARAGADLALVEREHGEAFDRLVEEVVVLAPSTSAKKMFGDLPPSSSVTGMMFSDGILHDQPAGRGLAGEGDLGDALVGRQRLAGLERRSR